MTLITDSVNKDAATPDIEFHFLKEANCLADQTNDPEVVVDLSEIATISSQDLSELIQFQAKIRRQGRTLVLENLQEQIFQVFTVTRLDRLFVLRNHAWS